QLVTEDVNPAGSSTALAMLLAHCPDSQVRDFARAETLARAGAEGRPASPGLRWLLASVLYRAGKWQEASDLFEQALAAADFPEEFPRTIIKIFQAMTRWQKGDCERARKDLPVLAAELRGDILATDFHWYVF